LLSIEVNLHDALNVQAYVSSLVALMKAKRKARTDVEDLRMDVEDVERTLKT
jgi:hypothetical protein